MAEDMVEDSKKISDLPNYAGGVERAVQDNAMLPVAIGNVSNAKIGMKALSVYMKQLANSNQLSPGENIQISSDNVISATDTIYDDTAVWARIEEIAELGVGTPGENGGGEAATVEVGTTETGLPGSEASVTNSGTPNAAVLDFVIPRGLPGAPGQPGNPGAPGAPGATGQPGQDGTGVNILGSYDTKSNLLSSQPTGNPGDGYMVLNDPSPGNNGLYVWDSLNNTWRWVGNIRGPKGDKGDPGAFVGVAPDITNITPLLEWSDVVPGARNAVGGHGTLTKSATVTQNGFARVYSFGVILGNDPNDIIASLYGNDYITVTRAGTTYTIERIEAGLYTRDTLSQIVLSRTSAWIPVKAGDIITVKEYNLYYNPAMGIYDLRRIDFAPYLETGEIGGGGVNFDGDPFQFVKGDGSLSNGYGEFLKELTGIYSNVSEPIGNTGFIVLMYEDKLVCTIITCVPCVGLLYTRPWRESVGDNFTFDEWLEVGSKYDDSEIMDILTVSPSRLLGRYSSSAGTPQEITLGSNLSLDSNGVLSASGGGGGGGIAAQTRLPQNEDWNNHTTSGFYLKQAVASAGDAPNGPPYYTAGTGDWSLFVIGGTDGGATGSNPPAAPGGCIQIARYASNSTITLYYRSNGVAGSSNGAGWSAWTSLAFWGGFNTGTNSTLKNPNNILTPGQYSNEWTSNSPSGVANPLKGSLLVLASDIAETAANRQQILIDSAGEGIWYRSSANGAWQPFSSIGIVPVSSGGTGSTTPSGALQNLGAAKKPDSIGSVSGTGTVNTFSKFIEWYINANNQILTITSSQIPEGETVLIKISCSDYNYLYGSYIRTQAEDGTYMNWEIGCITRSLVVAFKGWGNLRAIWRTNGYDV